jgi:hypothetical protein
MGFLLRFIKQLGSIKVDFMVMFVQLQSGELALFKLNLGVIILLPKK